VTKAGPPTEIGLIYRQSAPVVKVNCTAFTDQVKVVVAGNGARDALDYAKLGHRTYDCYQ
jgi:hypothetical protein